MKLSIGTANFLKRYGLLKTHVSNNEILKIFRFLKKNNLKNLDTAIEYDNFFKLRNKINFDKFLISSKINFIENNFSQKYLRILKKQIDSNKFKQYETIFIHNFGEIQKKNHQKIFEFMNLLKRLRLTKKIGISIYNPNNLNDIKTSYNVDVVQAPVSIFDRRFLSSSVINILKKKKLSLQARSIFLQGTLLNSKKIIKNFDLKKKNIFYEYQKWCTDQKIDKRKSCIDFIKDQKIIDSVVVGVESLSQFKEVYKDFTSKSKKNYPKNIFSNNKNLIDARRW
jgi:aryl-alcohol dehydrogenase-like predicted oxidoreductase